ncbi:ArsR/SmtB family transcription factor [Fulvivirga lutimaris]|uniref:ArsR/SmtB family transcription factor n=1 Tax=Fulvivirga lutimaris TaxID=1819566 RepID=UPI0012BC39EA|nr:metalloregulator ArsR/SmtB family transcription factor [Fulvivirga lutimaris]MTI39276.1 ArsR family transcriptional regulator [Fulvivirga lutimaris]
MEKPHNQHIDKIFKAIADPTRREIFHALVVASVALSITQISERYDISRQGVTKHIKTLQQAGLITINAHGRERYCLPSTKPLKLVKDWVNFYDKFWDDSLSRLGDHLDSQT